MNEVFEQWFNEVVKPLNADTNFWFHMKAAMRSAFEVAWNHQQAEIDRLMLEFCPDEMTEAQMNTWAEHQRRIK